MAALTLFMTNNLGGAGIHQEISETSPGAAALASPATGWILGTNAAAKYASFNAQTEVARTTFAATVLPGTTINTAAGSGNGLRSQNAYTGDFSSGNWVFTMAVRSVTAAYTGRWRIRARLYRTTDSTPAGSTDIGGGVDVLSAATTASMTTTADTVLTITFASVPLTTFSNEFILMTLAAEPTTAGGGTTQDADIRIGTGETTLLTPNFTVFVPVIPDIVMAPPGR